MERIQHFVQHTRTGRVHDREIPELRGHIVTDDARLPLLLRRGGWQGAGIFRHTAAGRPTIPEQVLYPAREPRPRDLLGGHRVHEVALPRRGPHGHIPDRKPQQYTRL